MKTSFDITKLILHKPNFLSKEECDLLINYYENNKKQKIREHCPHAVTGIETESTFDVIDIPYGTEENKLISSSIEKMINMWQDYTDKFKMFHVHKRSSMLYSHKLRLMKYETGAKIHPHSDHDPYIYGSCTFNLNEEYEGGEFVFFRGNKKMQLKRGDALIFPADHFWVHEVKPIKKGVRYSTNCFLQNMPTSLREHLTRLENVLRNSYKFNPKDGIRYNIK
jgi:hypothetical protein|tara:strand:+ start:89 stop:757 length:669 start_codon:yes stop_codon:yes gene_type:complete